MPETGLPGFVVGNQLAGLNTPPAQRKQRLVVEVKNIQRAVNPPRFLQPAAKLQTQLPEEVVKMRTHIPQLFFPPDQPALLRQLPAQPARLDAGQQGCLLPVLLCQLCRQIQRRLAQK